MNQQSRDRSLSPLSKNPLSIGKFVTYTREDNQNPQAFSLINTSPRNVGTNTSRVGHFALGDSEQVKPITHVKMQSSVYDLNGNNTDEQSPQLTRKCKKKMVHLSIGKIHRQNNCAKSAPKDFGATAHSSTSPQFPYIKKIDKNIQGLKEFIESSPSFSSSEMSKKTNRSIGRTYIPIYRQISDSAEQQKLQQPQRSFLKVSSRFKLPTFKDQGQNSFQQQTSQERTEQEINLHGSKISRKTLKANDSRVEDLQSSNKMYGNSFLRSYQNNCNPQNLLIIDLRTSLSKIKQALVESERQLHVTFIMPELFFNPPSSSTTSQELHLLMLEIFSHIGVNPQIVSIKKYVNCILLREKNLCILWNFNGKIYFGGWSRNSSLAEGNKHGLGIEWVPSRYVYYGEFKDNKKQGCGIMKKSNRQVYIGCWKNNQRWGWGKVYDSEGQLHQNGDFAQGCFISEKSSD